MKNCHLLVAIVLASIMISCKAGPGKKERLPGYNLESPDLNLNLPDILYEISGQTYIDPTSFACIQDNKGILFIYDFAKKEIKKQFTFFSNGDYEGIAKVEDTIYVLRSDGTLFEISDYNSDNVIVIPYPTYIPVRNNEGLCYDAAGYRLLIAGKENTGKGEGLKDRRFVFGFDVKTKSLLPEPVYTFSIKSLKEFAINSGFDLPVKQKKKKKKVLSVEPVFLFRPSAMCFHPITGDLIILSSEDHLIFAFDNSGKIKNIARLNPLLFPQPEGITFLMNGDMLISNEGQGKRPATLLRFDYHRSSKK
jgi:SdiA-regulated